MKRGSPKQLSQCHSQAEQNKDWNKVVVGYQHLAQIAAGSGNVDAAKGRLERALKIAEKFEQFRNAEENQRPNS